MLTTQGRVAEVSGSRPAIQRMLLILPSIVLPPARTDLTDNLSILPLLMLILLFF